ncbi:DUF4157 domain-containing protein [Undibacterium sp. Ji49W]|uniref:eCIS core domain-containing protein n=1 Tax=Undibacterium sp. Ji49W TaxID=3413040 RepID=UPI003BF16A21
MKTTIQEHQEQSATQHMHGKTKHGVATVNDTRPQALMQRAHQQSANNSKQALQLRHLQSLQDNSPQATQMRAMAQLMRGETPGITQRVEEKSPPPVAVAVKPNQTGLPHQLKAGIESLSGMSLDHVKVHYNSDKPAQMQAHAYAQGSNIHVAPGQEKHLPHEAWHVVQQAQGRVRPTMQMKTGIPVNDDVSLEAEADTMGARAMQLKLDDNTTQLTHNGTYTDNANSADAGVAQRALATDKLNVVGENHDESDPRREQEKTYTKSIIGDDAGYWGEADFALGDKTGWGDPKHLRIANILELIHDFFKPLTKLGIIFSETEGPLPTEWVIKIKAAFAKSLAIHFERLIQEISVNVQLIREGKDVLSQHMDRPFTAWAKEAIQLRRDLMQRIADIDLYLESGIDTKDLKFNLFGTSLEIEYFASKSINALQAEIPLAEFERSMEMDSAASAAYARKGVWKIGQKHVDDIHFLHIGKEARYQVMNKADFNQLLNT